VLRAVRHLFGSYAKALLTEAKDWVNAL